MITVIFSIRSQGANRISNMIVILSICTKGFKRIWFQWSNRRSNIFIKWSKVKLLKSAKIRKGSKKTCLGPSNLTGAQTGKNWRKSAKTGAKMANKTTKTAKTAKMAQNGTKWREICRTIYLAKWFKNWFAKIFSNYSIY